MGDADAVNAVPIVGGPLAYGLGLGVLLLVLLTGSWAGALVTVAHEAGHMVAAVLTLRWHGGFSLDDYGGGETWSERPKWSIGALLGTFSGYPFPPLLGLGGAYLVTTGRPAAALWISLVLLLGALVEAANPLAGVVTGLAALGVGWAAAAGGIQVQAAVAVGLVWLLLIGGAHHSTFALSREDGSDAASLAGRTFVPRIVWHAVWAAIGVLCLWNGGSWLLGLG